MVRLNINTENVGETNFVLNFDNGGKLGFRVGDDEKYADAVSGGRFLT